MEHYAHSEAPPASSHAPPPAAQDDATVDDWARDDAELMTVDSHHSGAPAEGGDAVVDAAPPAPTAEGPLSSLSSSLSLPLRCSVVAALRSELVPRRSVVLARSIASLSRFRRVCSGCVGCRCGQRGDLDYLD